MKYEFNANHRVIASTEGCTTIGDMEKEQGMYSATPEFCFDHGGPITRRLLELVPQSYLDETDNRGLFANIDVRVHRLYPGNYPAYPGWHCDAQFRETFFGQPRTERTEVSDHLIATISTHEEGVSLTEFVDDEISLNIDNYAPEEGTSFWQLVDTQMQDEIFNSSLMQDGDLTRFDCWTLHRCTPAQIRGWRLFFRVAMWYRPNLDGGKLSKQEVIYMDMNKPTGW